MPDTASPPTVKTEAPAENLHHPSVPFETLAEREHDRVVTDSGLYVQDHWRDEFAEACSRAARLRQCAQHEVDALDEEIGRLTRLRDTWAGQARAHSVMLESLHSASEQAQSVEMEHAVKRKSAEAAPDWHRGEDVGLEAPEPQRFGMARPRMDRR